MVRLKTSVASYAGLVDRCELDVFQSRPPVRKGKDQEELIVIKQIRSLIETFFSFIRCKIIPGNEQVFWDLALTDSNIEAANEVG